MALAWAKLQNHLASMPHTQALNLMEFEATNLSFDRQADTADVRKEQRRLTLDHTGRARARVQNKKNHKKLLYRTFNSLLSPLT